MKMSMNYKQFKQMVEMIGGGKIEQKYAIQTYKDGCKGTATLYICYSPNCPSFNISKLSNGTHVFKSVEELNEVLAKHFQIFKSDKAMWQEYDGMDDETWEEWNK